MSKIQIKYYLNSYGSFEASVACRFQQFSYQQTIFRSSTRPSIPFAHTSAAGVCTTARSIVHSVAPAFFLKNASRSPPNQFTLLFASSHRSVVRRSERRRRRYLKIRLRRYTAAGGWGWRTGASPAGRRLWRGSRGESAEVWERGVEASESAEPCTSLLIRWGWLGGTRLLELINT